MWSESCSASIVNLEKKLQQFQIYQIFPRGGLLFWRALYNVTVCYTLVSSHHILTTQHNTTLYNFTYLDKQHISNMSVIINSTQVTAPVNEFSVNMWTCCSVNSRPAIPISSPHKSIPIPLRYTKALNIKLFSVFFRTRLDGWCPDSGVQTPRTQISSLVRKKSKKTKISRSEFVLFCLAYALAATINAWRRSNFRFQSTAVDYRSITADKSSITAVTPQQLTPTCTGKNRGITAVPITVQLSKPWGLGDSNCRLWQRSKLLELKVHWSLHLPQLNYMYNWICELHQLGLM